MSERFVRDQLEEWREKGWSPTGRQLYYLVCRASEPPLYPVGMSQIVVGVVVVVAGIVGVFAHWGAGVPAIIGGILLGLVGGENRRRESHRSLILPRPLGWDDFLHSFMEGDPPLPGLAPDTVTPPKPEAHRLTVLVDHERTAAALLANAGKLDTPINVVVGLARQRSPTQGPLLLLHDVEIEAVARACSFVRRHPTAIDVSPNVDEVTTAPHHIIEGPPLAAHIAKEGVPVDLLDERSRRWLMAGRRMEISSLAPDALIERIREGSTRATTRAGGATEVTSREDATPPA